MAEKKHLQEHQIQEIERIVFKIKVCMTISIDPNIFEASLATKYGLVQKLKIMQ